MEEHGLEIIREHPQTMHQARLSRHAEYRDSPTCGILRSTSAQGKTEAEATQNLIQTLSGKLLVLDAYRVSRQKIQLRQFSSAEGCDAGKHGTGGV